MEQEPGSPSRRRVLKTFALGGVGALAILLPSKWTRPVVESIVVPGPRRGNRRRQRPRPTRIVE